MHNLGLGDLEFDPGHTVDQHRPDGFKVPDINVAVEDEHEKRTQNADSVDIKIENDNVNRKPSNGKVQTSDFESAITWKSDDFEDTSFASLHNPKHVHHSQRKFALHFFFNFISTES